MSWHDYKEEDLIRVMPYNIKGGIDTLCALARLFKINLDSEPWPGPIIMCIKSLSIKDRETLREFLTDYTKKETKS